MTGKSALAQGSLNTSLYERDTYAWSIEQAALLRAGRLSEADIENIAEEIESVGKSEKRELESRLRVLLMHLLKWQFQPERRGGSWRTTIDAQRVGIADHLEDNPSLKSQLQVAIVRAYRLAGIDASGETGLRRGDFPPACPWSFAQFSDADFWPE